MGRVDYDFDSIIPGAVQLSDRTISIPYGCKEHRFVRYETLTCSDLETLYWESNSDGNVPPSAMQAGKNAWDEVLYVGRTCTPIKQGRTAAGNKLSPTKIFTGPLLGKIHPSHRCLYVAYNGDEYLFPSYEVLCEIVVPPFDHTSKAEAWWTKASGGVIPQGTLPAGTTATGEITFIGRATQNRQYVPGPLVSSNKCLLVSWSAFEQQHDDYEAFVASDHAAFGWELASQGEVPSNAVPVCERPGEMIFIGRTVSGCDLSVGRTYQGIPIQITAPAVPGTQLVGKIHPSHRCLYLPHGGREFLYQTYEALVIKSRPKSLQEFCRHLIRTLTNGVPSRIEQLPLPSHLIDYCKISH